MWAVIQMVLAGYAGWRAFVNFFYFSEAEKKYGAFPPHDLPNYGARGWIWLAIALFFGFRFISGGTGSECLRYC